MRDGGDNLNRDEPLEFETLPRKIHQKHIKSTPKTIPVTRRIGSQNKKSGVTFFNSKCKLFM